MREREDEREFLKGGGRWDSHRGERGRRRREVKTCRERKATRWIGHFMDLYSGPAFYQNTCVKRHGIAFLNTYCTKPLVSSYFW